MKKIYVCLILLHIENFKFTILLFLYLHTSQISYDNISFSIYSFLAYYLPLTLIRISYPLFPIYDEYHFPQSIDTFFLHFQKRKNFFFKCTLYFHSNVIFTFVNMLLVSTLFISTTLRIGHRHSPANSIEKGHDVARNTYSVGR